LNAVQALGWTIESWSGSSAELTPTSESKKWAELTPAEQAAAIDLCYSSLTWDLVPLPEWETTTAQNVKMENKTGENIHFPTTSPVAFSVSTTDEEAATVTNKPTGSILTDPEQGEANLENTSSAAASRISVSFAHLLLSAIVLFCTGLIKH